MNAGISPSTKLSTRKGILVLQVFAIGKHATGSKGVLYTYNNCFSHKESMIAWEQIKSTATTRSVVGGNQREELLKRIDTILNGG